MSNTNTLLDLSYIFINGFYSRLKTTLDKRKNREIHKKTALKELPQTTHYWANMKDFTVEDAT